MEQNNINNPKGSGFGGKVTKLPDSIYAALRKPMPVESIKPHPTKTYLSTIKAIYVTERLNNIFGIGGWDLEHEEVKCAAPNYALVRGRLYFREYDLYTPYQYGGHQTDGKGNEIADGYKSAVTDLQSKCASLVEIGIDVFKGKGAVPVKEEKPQTPSPAVTHLSKKAEEPVAAKEEPKKETPKPEAKKPAKKEVATAAFHKGDEDIPTLNPIFKEYHDDVVSYVSSDALKDNAKSIVDAATAKGLPENLVTILKEVINEQYSKLKDAGN